MEKIPFTLTELANASVSPTFTESVCVPLAAPRVRVSIDRAVPESVTV